MKKEQEDGKFPKVIKWVGYLTAICSLAATVVGVAKYVYGHSETKRT